MFKDKKGISPLIATVLVIGFTIILAAMVITWGGGIFQDIQDDTAKNAQMNTQCSYLLTGIAVKSAAVSEAGIYSLVIDNNNPKSIDITGIDLKIYNADGEAKICSTGDKAIKAGEATKVSCTGPLVEFEGTATEVGAYAYIQIDDESIKCAQEIGKSKL